MKPIIKKHQRRYLVWPVALFGLACSSLVHASVHEARGIEDFMPSIAITYSGQALGNFSSSNYLSGGTGTNLIPFAPGMTLWLQLQLLGSTAGVSEAIIVSNDAPTFTKGWGLIRLGSNASPNQGQLYFFNGNTGGVAQFAPIANGGVASVALIWRASDNHMIVVENGGWANGGPGPYYDAGAITNTGNCGSTCVTYVGAGNWGSGPGAYPASDVRLLAMATWNREASVVEAQKGTFTSGNRFNLPSMVRSNAVVDFQPGRDWNSSTSKYVSLGSSPITLTPSGSPSLVSVAETRFATDSTMYSDGAFAENMSDPEGYTWVVRNPFDYVQAKTDALYASVETYTTTVWSRAAAAATYVNGSYNSSFFPFPASSAVYAGPFWNYPMMVDAVLPSGAGKTVQLWEGGGDANDYAVQPYGRWGTYIQAVRLPTLAYDGTTNTYSEMLPPNAPPKHRVVLLMDYLADMSSGFITPNQTAIGLLRASYPYPTDGITMAGSISLSMAEYAIRPDSVSSIIAELNGTSTNTVWINLGSLDYAGPNPIDVPTYQARYQSVVNGICANKPGTYLYLQSPIQRVSPLNENANAFGYTLPNFRTAISNIASACPTGCTCSYVNCAAGACVSNGNIDSGGLWLTITGISQLEGVISSTLSGAGLL